MNEEREFVEALRKEKEFVETLRSLSAGSLLIVEYFLKGLVATQNTPESEEVLKILLHAQSEPGLFASFRQALAIAAEEGRDFPRFAREWKQSVTRAVPIIEHDA